MLAKPIFETLPIAIIAVCIFFMLTLHSILAFLIGSIMIVTACVMLYVRLAEVGTDPDAMDYVDTADHIV